jgi:mannose/fructose-specific phosphotransferase system component IIA
MSEALRGVVVCHGRLAGALVDAAEQISGVTGALLAVSNTGCDRGTLEERVEAAVGDGPAVVFVDLASGSCLFAVLNRLRANARAKVVTGVNLAMLVDFVFHRSLPVDEAAAKAAIAGGKAIRVP